MFDLELEWTVGVGGGGRARRHLHEEAVEKKNTPWLVACHCISGNATGNKSKWVKLKTGSTVIQRKQTRVEPMSETVKQFFFSQKRIGFDKTSFALTNMSWYLLHSIFSERKSLSIAAFNLFDSFSFFFHLIVNDTLKQQTTALEGLPAIIFVSKRSLLTQIRVDICRTLYTPNDNPWAYLPFIRFNMLTPFDHKQSAEADKQTILCSK